MPGYADMRPVRLPVLQSYVWHERDASGVPWIRLVAALLLGTVTDALMRIAHAGAHLMLLSYRLPVKRKVCAAYRCCRLLAITQAQLRLPHCQIHPQAARCTWLCC